ncbi:exostosin domain-containing protein [Jejuia spongiicola]|uniref:Glycosyltransferase family 47 protein n=1 Tax=Jejuia spongiicola TaxID=2942207 RepID=A0ABT0QCK3_9FLAO|nr:exostosin family protein [Jejuia spongiicola]MCL6294680.1 glycosyltransferase family 47 protein [Jejuia spongiicola]
MLKLYTDKTFLKEQHRSKVFPLLFDLFYLKNKTLVSYYAIIDDISDCDIVVFPIDYSSFFKKRNAFNKLNKAAKKNQKPIWLYTSGDYGFTVYIANSYNFRLGGLNSKLHNSTVIIPSFINDPYQSNLKESFSTLKKKNKPNIGFVGHAQGGLLKYIKEYLSYMKTNFNRKLKQNKIDFQPFYPSSIKRKEYLDLLLISNKIEAQFVLRKKYRAGVKTIEDKQKTTQEFYQNIYNNAYTFCIRGAGNFSVRFYETLAVGRIPVLLNTDCRLPLSDIIDWKKHCVILDVTKKESLEEQILKFHNSKGEDEFETIQKNNRNLWETHLKRESFFIKFYKVFKKQK